MHDTTLVPEFTGHLPCGLPATRGLLGHIVLRRCLSRTFFFVVELHVIQLHLNGGVLVLWLAD